jgi:hypothetical protein
MRRARNDKERDAQNDKRQRAEDDKWMLLNNLQLKELVGYDVL